MALNIEHEALVDLLTTTRSTTTAALTDADLRQFTNDHGTGYTLLNHLSAWELLAAQTLAAHGQGRPLPPLPLDQRMRQQFNAHIFATQRHDTPEQIWQRWHSARQALIATIEQLPFAAVHTPLCSHAGSAYVGEIVKRLIGHEQLHLHQVWQAQQRPHPYRALDQR